MADLPTRFESLNDDTLTTIAEFVGNKSYRAFGGLDKRCREIYLNTKGMKKETFLYGYAPLAVIIDKVNVIIEGTSPYLLRYVLSAVGGGVVFYNRNDVLAWALEDQNNDVLRGICKVAAGERRFDLLNEVFNNVDDREDKEYIFLYAGENAAYGGKLEVLKWLDTKGLNIGFRCVNAAACGGQLHILKWLREEKSLELYRELYCNAIGGGHLHVLKWLREQEVPWAEWTFKFAASEENLEILQWLHDEGCPWPEPWDDDVFVHEDNTKPEILNWLRANGYGERIH
eukprot:CAMPEP_0178957400 /NCGR_PEP_ID=MMETSP0789-20121207/10888_1 /TAXON_ID=3005 /ORGANISM="Rhizosolenia setigera, Strain CCMP 1694" /LENGTH=285 /DNA_ID=CAMNT_0020639635 /DNA_START=294 /DNA_END=1151 /DNA_ORIENTATION=-